MTLRQKIRFTTTHDGVRLAIATTGSGPPLVKASNWLSHLDRDLDSPVWDHMIEALSQTHTLVRYDQRGSGLSDWNVDDISLDAWVRDLATVVDALGLERFPLLALSQGLPIAVEFMHRHPGRVTTLVAHGGYARGRRKRNNPLTVEEADVLVRLAELGWGRDDTSFRQVFTSQFLPGGTPEQHRWFNDLARESTSAANAGRMIRVFDDIDVAANLGAVDCPTLVLHATGDRRVPFDEGRFVAGRIPQARFVPLDSDNHLIQRHEKAWTRWLEEVREFLRASGDGALDSAFATLTARERELLELIAQGRDNAQIAATLALSEKTVRNHITHIFDKLAVESRAQAIVRARDAGFGRPRTR